MYKNDAARRDRRIAAASVRTGCAMTNPGLGAFLLRLLTTDDSGAMKASRPTRARPTTAGDREGRPYVLSLKLNLIMFR